MYDKNQDSRGFPQNTKMDVASWEFEERQLKPRSAVIE